MRILLTGAAGFIGSRVYQQLLGKGQDDIIAVSRHPLYEQYVLDILNQEAVSSFIEEHKPDTLIHLAWDVTHGDFWGSSLNKDYLDASKHLCNIFLEQGGSKIIAAGTCAEYPTRPYPVREDVECEGELTPYGVAKKKLFQHLCCMQTTYTFDFAWLRIFGIYGEGEDERRFFPLMRQAVLEGKDPTIKNPHIFADYMHVEAVAEIFVRCLDAGNIGAVNVGSGISMALCDWYEKIKAEMMGHTFSNTFWLTPDHQSRIPDCGKLTKEIKG